MIMGDELAKRFLASFSECPDAACALGEDGRILGTNNAFAERFGRGQEALHGQLLVDLFITEDRHEVLEKLAMLSLPTTGRADCSFETSSRTEGSLGATLASSWTVWRASSEPLVFIAVAREARILPSGVVDVKQMVRAHEILDTSPTFVVGIAPSGNTIFMNATMLGALGYTREEVIGQDYMTMFVPLRDQPVLTKVFGELLQARGTTFNENRVLTRSGRELLIEWHGRVVTDEKGDVDYFYGVGIDVTSLRRMRDALLRSQQRLGLHFQQAPLGMIEWDKDFRVVDWNPAAERMFGWTRQEAMGQKGQELMVPPAVQPYVADIWEAILSTKGAVQAANENITKDGRTIVCEWSNTALVDEDGEVVGVSSLVNDITERSQAEEALRERERAQAETIQQLSAPVLDLWQNVLAMPVIGVIDEARAGRMMQGLLEAIVLRAARFSILDLTGATAMDASIATHISDMVRATRLIGSECIVSGLSPAMAKTLAELDVPLSIRTFASLQAALRYAIRATKG